MIGLPFDIPRCEPSKGARAQGSCARAKAPTNARTTTLDYSADGCTPLCAGYINLAGLLQQPEAEIARVRAAAKATA